MYLEQNCVITHVRSRHERTLDAFLFHYFLQHPLLHQLFFATCTSIQMTCTSSAYCVFDFDDHYKSGTDRQSQKRVIESPMGFKKETYHATHEM